MSIFDIDYENDVRLKQLFMKYVAGLAEKDEQGGLIYSKTQDNYISVKFKKNGLRAVQYYDNYASIMYIVDVENKKIVREKKFRYGQKKNII